jgi:hypothetical protein
MKKIIASVLVLCLAASVLSGCNVEQSEVSASPVHTSGVTTSPSKAPEATASPEISFPPVGSEEPEPFLVQVTDDAINEYLMELDREYEPIFIGTIDDGKSGIVLYGHSSNYEVYEINVYSDGRRVVNAREPYLLGGITHTHDLLFKGESIVTGTPYMIITSNLEEIRESADKTVIYNFDESFELDGFYNRVTLVENPEFLFLTHIKTYDSNNILIDLCYFNRKVIKQPEIVPPQEVIYFENGMVIHTWGGGTSSLLFDLDGDGEKDIIEFAFPMFGPNSHKLINTEDLDAARKELSSLPTDGAAVRINENELNVYGIDFQGLIYVIDIDSSDGKYELLVAEEGPSCDYISTIIGYDSNGPYIMGKVGGLPEYNVVADSNGKLYANNRGTIISTWFYDAVYAIENGYLVEVRENGYVNINWPVTALIDLQLQVSPEDDTTAYTMKKDDKVKLTWTNDENWVCVENAEGIEGWFEMDGYDHIILIDKSTREVFSGLSYAD